MRQAIERFLQDEKRYPPSLDMLVDAGYLAKIPWDPVNDNDVWDEIPADPDATDHPVSGIWDVRSLARGTSLDGRKYHEF